MRLQKLLRHGKKELIADAVLIEIEGMISVGKSDRLYLDARALRLLGEVDCGGRRKQMVVLAEHDQRRRGGGIDVGSRRHEPGSIRKMFGTAAQVIRVEPAGSIRHSRFPTLPRSGEVHRRIEGDDGRR